MAIKEIPVKINVDDTQFKEFAQLFAKYRAALKGVPGEWAKVSRESKTTKAFLEGIVAAGFAQTAMMKKHEDSAKKTEESTKKTSNHWKEIAKSTGSVVKNIFKATESLLKWSLLTEAALGLAGAGGLFGLSRLAGNVAAGRRSSLGLGTSYGSEKSFGVNFGQLVDPGSFLGAVSRARADMTNTGFIGAGMTYAEQQGDTATVAVNLIRHLKKIADNTDPRALENTMKMLGIDQFASVEDMRRFRATKLSDLEANVTRFGGDASRLGLSPEVQNQWMRFTQQMERAGIDIQNTFAKTLVRLAPNIERLSDSFVRLVEKVGESGPVQKWMGQLSDWLGDMADAVGTDDFADKVQRFTSSVGDVVDGLVQIGHGITWLARKMGWIDSHPTAEDLYVPKYVFPKFQKQSSGFGATGDGRTGSWQGPEGATGTWGSKYPFSGMESAAGLPAGTLNSVYMAESGGGKFLRSKKGAIGPFQFMPRTARQWVKGDPMDPVAAAQGAADYLHYLTGVSHGDLARGVASYNWGEGRMARHGEVDWRSHIPDETKRYLGRVFGGIGGEAAVREGNAPGVSPMELRELLKTLSKNNDTKTIVEVFNNSGGSAVVSTSMVAQ